MKEERKITTGLTIPYIFRAYQMQKNPLKDIPQLMNIILNSKTEKMPVLHMCPEIHHIVLLVEDRTRCNREYKDYFSFPSTYEERYLLLSPDALFLGKTPARVCNNLAGLYGNRIHIKECSWSKRKKDWGEIDKEESAIIESIK
ncbi:MAG TPA: hypothetical protein VK498_09085 [Ferruginibacter sp.]|nr:hypothetical protein [Ferruginibacter sp.]